MKKIFDSKFEIRVKVYNRFFNFKIRRVNFDDANKN